MSEPERMGACRLHSAPVRVKRGSTWISVAPRRCASTRKRNAIGWFSAMLEPMVMTQSEFAQVQVFLKRPGTGRPAPDVGRETVPFVRPPTRQRRHDLAFAGLMRCGRCGVGMVSATISKGKVYYHCSNRKGICNKSGVREEEITKQLSTWVAAVSFPSHLESSLQQALERQLADEYNPEQRERAEQEKQRRLGAAHSRLSRLRGLVADGGGPGHHKLLGATRGPRRGGLGQLPRRRRR